MPQHNNGCSLVIDKTNFYNHFIYHGLHLVCNFFFMLAYNVLGKKASGMVTEAALKSHREKGRGFSTLQIISLLPFFFSSVLVLRFLGS
ncbi:MAG: hypothetical protein D6785_05075, partial [Planctomycetota bacterium]